MKTFYLAVSSIVLAYVFVLLAGAFAWRYFSNSLNHYIAATLALPFRLSAMIAADRWQAWLAFAIYCFVSFGIIVGLKRIASRFWPGPKISGSLDRM